MPAPLHPRSGWTGLLLAGGQSLRMGKEKAALPSSNQFGQTLFEDALGKLQFSCAQVIVLGGEQCANAQGPDLLFLADAKESGGPLPALGDAMRALTTEWCLVLPLDMPGIGNDLLEAGMERIETPDACAHPGMFAADHRNHGCFPLWLHQSAGPSLRSAIKEGERSLFRALFHVGAVSWNPPAGLESMGNDPFRNLNTPEDLEAWQRSQAVQGAVI